MHKLLKVFAFRRKLANPLNILATCHNQNSTLVVQFIIQNKYIKIQSKIMSSSWDRAQRDETISM